MVLPWHHPITLRRVFSVLDIDDDGLLTKEDIWSTLSLLESQPEHELKQNIDHLMRAMQFYSCRVDRAVDFPTFLQWIQKTIESEDVSQGLEYLFKCLDRKKNGSINPQDIYEKIPKMKNYYELDDLKSLFPSPCHLTQFLALNDALE